MLAWEVGGDIRQQKIWKMKKKIDCQNVREIVFEMKRRWKMRDTETQNK